MIEVKYFPKKGRGIVATKPISKDTVIEVAPGWLFSSNTKTPHE